MARSTAAIRVFGENLDPDAISQLLGCSPDWSYRRGDPISPGRKTATRKYGMWSLKAQEADPVSFDSQITALLANLTQDTTVWTALGRDYQVYLFCGFFMDTRNQGFTLSIETLQSLASRGIEPGFDIYAPSDEEEAEYRANQEGAGDA